MSSHWQTPVPIPAYPTHLRYGQPVVALGSCFAEYMGRHLAEAKFVPVINPFGILYNPLSITRALERMRIGYEYQLNRSTPCLLRMTTICCDESGESSRQAVTAPCIHRLLRTTLFCVSS